MHMRKKNFQGDRKVSFSKQFGKQILREEEKEKFQFDVNNERPTTTNLFAHTTNK
jgi:hypothetical protein